MRAQFSNQCSRKSSGTLVHADSRRSQKLEQTASRVLLELDSGGHLSSLNLSNVHFAMPFLNALQKRLAHNTVLEQLHMDSCQFVCAHANVIANMLIANYQCGGKIRILSVQNNRLKSLGAIHLCRALQQPKTGNHLTRLQCLSLNGNEIGPTGCKRFSEVLVGTSILKKLNLQHNCIDDWGAGWLSLILRNNVSLELLDVRWNPIGADGADELRRACINGRVHLCWTFIIHADKRRKNGRRKILISTPPHMAPGAFRKITGSRPSSATYRAANPEAGKLLPLSQHDSDEGNKSVVRLVASRFRWKYRSGYSLENDAKVSVCRPSSAPPLRKAPSAPPQSLGAAGGSAAVCRGPDALGSPNPKLNPNPNHRRAPDHPSPPKTGTNVPYLDSNEALELANAGRKQKAKHVERPGNKFENAVSVSSNSPSPKAQTRNTEDIGLFRRCSSLTSILRNNHADCTALVLRERSKRKPLMGGANRRKRLSGSTHSEIARELDRMWRPDSRRQSYSSRGLSDFSSPGGTPLRKARGAGGALAASKPVLSPPDVSFEWPTNSADSVDFHTSRNSHANTSGGESPSPPRDLLPPRRVSFPSQPSSSVSPASKRDLIDPSSARGDISQRGAVKFQLEFIDAIATVAHSNPLRETTTPAQDGAHGPTALLRTEVPADQEVVPNRPSSLAAPQQEHIDTSGGETAQLSRVPADSPLRGGSAALDRETSAPSNNLPYNPPRSPSDADSREPSTRDRKSPDTPARGGSSPMGSAPRALGSRSPDSPPGRASDTEYRETCSVGSTSPASLQRCRRAASGHETPSHGCASPKSPLRGSIESLGSESPPRGRISMDSVHRGNNDSPNRGPSTPGSASPVAKARSWSVDVHHQINARLREPRSISPGGTGKENPCWLGAHGRTPVAEGDVSGLITKWQEKVGLPLQTVQICLDVLLRETTNDALEMHIFPASVFCKVLRQLHLTDVPTIADFYSLEDMLNTLSDHSSGRGRKRGVRKRQDFAHAK